VTIMIGMETEITGSITIEELKRKVKYYKI